MVLFTTAIPTFKNFFSLYLLIFTSLNILLSPCIFLILYSTETFDKQPTIHSLLCVYVVNIKLAQYVIIMWYYTCTTQHCLLGHTVAGVF